MTQNGYNCRKDANAEKSSTPAGAERVALMTDARGLIAVANIYYAATEWTIKKSLTKFNPFFGRFECARKRDVLI